jgi:Ser/Thr protein kinase RdoA (MazF antagonist)
VRSAAGPLLAKIGPAGTDVRKWRSAIAAGELARAAGVPVPELVAFIDASAPLQGRPLRAFRWVEGQHPAEVVAEASMRVRFFEQLGEAVARLHRVELPAFTSRIEGDAPEFDRWSDYLAYRWKSVRTRAVAAAMDDDLLDQVHARLVPLARSLDPIAAPVLCHRDIYLDNLLCDRDANLVAILDFDSAEAWDCTGDFFKLRWLIFESVPESERAFLSGYHRSIPEFERRLTAVELIELVNGIANAARRDPAWADRARARLDRYF